MTGDQIEFSSVCNGKLNTLPYLEAWLAATCEYEGTDFSAMLCAILSLSYADNVGVDVLSLSPLLLTESSLLLPTLDFEWTALVLLL